MKARVSGTISSKPVLLNPEHKKTNGSTLGPETIHKLFDGGLAAVCEKPSITAGYRLAHPQTYEVRERIKGTLDGRKGSFVLKYEFKAGGTVGSPPSTITVVPSSGKGELKGLLGEMTITKKGGEEIYVFEYELPE